MKRVVVALATVGYVGKIPYGPGTFGSLVAALLVLAVPHPYWVIFWFVIGTFVALLIARPAVEILGSEDPPSFVLDEFAGMMTSLLFLPLTWPWILAAFLLFRFFDCVKPLGIRAIDRMNHPRSIVLDDVVAGIYTNVILQIAVRLFERMS